MKIRKVVHFFLSVPKYLKIMGAADCLRVFRKEILSSGKERYSVRIRQNGGKPVELRPHSSDCSCLLGVFYEQYHLPPGQLPEEALILDLGCNAGYTAAHFASLYPRATVVGLEMDAANHRLATDNTRAFPNCRIRNQAVAVTDDVIYYTPDADEVAYRIDANRDYEPGKDIEVDAVSMKTLCADFPGRKIDYVKMDIEGEEDRIFADEAADYPWLEQVQTMNIEVHSGESSIGKIISILEKCGFKAWKDTHHWSAVIAVRKPV